MVLRDSSGGHYYVWISRKKPGVARAPGQPVTAPAPDGVTYGGRGQGDDKSDIRAEGSGDSDTEAPEEGSDSDGPDIR